MVGRTMTSSDHRLWFPPPGLPTPARAAKPFGQGRNELIDSRHKKTSRSVNNGCWVAALARLGAGDAACVAEGVGPAEVEAMVESAITADEAAERTVASRSALPLTLAGC